MNFGRVSPDRQAAEAWSNLEVERAKLHAAPQIVKPTETDLANTPCRKGNPERFFPGEDVVRTNRAKVECHGCPLRDRCLETALKFREVSEWSGVWGATSYRERRRLLGKRSA